MEEKKLMVLDIQLFAEEEFDDDFSDEISDASAANVDENPVTDADSDDESVNSEEVDTEKSEENTNAEDDKTKKTKEYSERLKKDREKIRQELEDANTKKLDAIAKGQGFDNWKELETYAENEKLDRLGIVDKDEFKKYVDELISNNPRLIEANRIIEAQKQEAQQRLLYDEVEIIKTLDSDVKSLDDILNSDSYQVILDKVSKGSSLSDAYKIVHFDKLMSGKAERAASQAAKNVGNKQHIQTATGKTAKDVYVPDDTMAMYRKTLPDWTVEQIKEHYAKNGGGEI